jgi:hypothetical protein
MSDYDVGAVSLSSPPASAVIQPYRPAVLVRNNGVHDALAVGSLRIYGPAGLLTFTTAIYSGVIAPGETQPAQGVDYWTPPALGRYMVIAHVTCINDQDPTNDNLAPCFIQIIAGPPTPPTPVQMHAAQHEEGGGDELIIDGLHGRAADAQTALAHKASHQAAGSDQLDVTGLPGILAYGQPIADHAQTHEAEGGDRINVDGLHGQLYNVQKPDVHDNSAHDPNYSVNKHGNADHSTAFATDADLDTHKGKTKVHGCDPDDVLSTAHLTETTPHASSTNLEKTANKGESEGYASLDQFSHVPKEQLGADDVVPPDPSDKVLYEDQTWRAPIATPAAHHESHEPGGSDPLDFSSLFLTNAQAGLSIIGTGPPADFSLLNVTIPFLHNRQSIRFSLHCDLVSALGEVGVVGFWFDIAGALKGQIALVMLSNRSYTIEVEGIIHACSPTLYAGSLLLHSRRNDGIIDFIRGTTIAPFAIPITDTWMKVVADLTGLATTHLDLASSFARTELPPTP